MKKILLLIISISFVFSISACGKKGYMSGDEKNFKVITTFYPVYVTTLNIMDGADNVSLTNMTETDYGCMHDYALTAKDMKELYGAELFIASGMNMETFIEKHTLGIPSLEVLNSGEDVPEVLKGENGYNSHYWMNIDNAINQCDKIADALIKLNPENAEIYENNAVKYKEKLNALIAETEDRFSKINKQDMVVFGDSFDYFAEQFGFNIIKISSWHDGTSASPKEIAEVTEYMNKNDINKVYIEKSDPDRVALRAVKRETGCEVVEFDAAISGEINKDTKNAYINAIYHNVHAIEENMGKKFVAN